MEAIDLPVTSATLPERSKSASRVRAFVLAILMLGGVKRTNVFAVRLCFVESSGPLRSFCSAENVTLKREPSVALWTRVNEF
jgi:hypothetical protein